ncbi:MAG: hypothetical protein ABR991_05760 [Terracidiphilus sp.]
MGKKQKGGAARIGCAALAVIYTGLGETMRRISIKGVLIGAIADTFLSSFFGILAAIVVVVMSHMTHLPREVFHRHGILYAVLTLNGLALSVLGGYIAAFIAKHDELLNGGLSSFLCVFINIFFIAKATSHYPLIVQWLILFTVPFFAILGGYIRLRQKKTTESNQ